MIGRAALLLPFDDRMVIHAVHVFQCADVYCGCDRDSPYMFACDRCGHRAHALLLGARVSAGAASR